MQRAATATTTMPPTRGTGVACNDGSFGTSLARRAAAPVFSSTAISTPDATAHAVARRPSATAEFMELAPKPGAADLVELRVDRECRRIDVVRRVARRH